MAAELPTFDVAQALELGLVPLVRDAASPSDTLAAYATLYLEEEVQAESGFWAVEVKNTASVRPSDVRSLESFADDYPECSPTLVYRGRGRLRIGRVDCVPVEEFLMALKPGGTPFE